MKIAMYGTPSRWKFTCDYISRSITGLDVTHVVIPYNRDFSAQMPKNVKAVTVDESIQLYKEKIIDAIVLTNSTVDVDLPRSITRQHIRNYKASGVKNIFVLSNYPSDMSSVAFWKLHSEKSFLEYMETNLIDSCNLNCKACSHFSSLFKNDSVYPVEDFRRDVRELSKKIDLVTLRLMGGEAFLLKNLDDYCNIAREYFPQTFIIVVSNGLLIPQVSDKIFDSIKRNKIIVDVTQYQPTVKMKDQIEQVLKSKQVPYVFGREVEFFYAAVRNEPGLSDMNQSIRYCTNNICYFLRRGKVYKCPFDALVYKYGEKFNKMIPGGTGSGADIYAENFLEQLQYVVDFPVQNCKLCPEQYVKIPWKAENKPKAIDWTR